jgi:hypothetical protein
MKGGVAINEVKMLVIARAYDDQPLKRALTGQRGNLAYIVNPSTGNANGIAPFSGVGFPRDCVYRLEDSLFDTLKVAWDSGDRQRLASLWQKATPLYSPAKTAA